MGKLRRWSSLRSARSGRGETGQSLVEFVLILPILLVLLFGIIEFANAWRTSQFITNLSREGARRAVVPNSPSDANLEQALRDRLNEAGFDGSNSSTTITFACDGTTGSTCPTGSTGSMESVRIEYDYDFLFFGPLLSFMMGDSSGDDYQTYTLSSESVMRSE